MTWFDSMKTAAAKLVSQTPIAKNIGPVVLEALQKIEGSSAEFLGNADLFRAKLSDPSYNHLPTFLQQWVTPDQWHKFVNGMKDSVFMVVDGHVRIRPEFKAAVHEFGARLLYGEKWAEHVPGALPEKTETK